MLEGPPCLIGAVDIGGTHVSTSLVEVADGQLRIVGSARTSIDSQAPAAELIAAMANEARRMDEPAVAGWAFAVPGPFDYARGIARFEHVGKFDALCHVNVRGALSAALARPGSDLTFVHDAEAFLLGEWIAGGVVGVRRCVGITLGTGVGSAFLADGRVIREGDDVPPDGSVHHLDISGVPLEDLVSRRAIMAAYGTGQGDQLDVAGIAGRARRGDARAQVVFRDALCALGAVLAPWIDFFAADAVVVGGSIARSWDLVLPALRSGLGPALTDLPVLQSSLFEEAALLGAAFQAPKPGRLPKVDGGVTTCT
jgi:glucokinase